MWHGGFSRYQLLLFRLCPLCVSPPRPPTPFAAIQFYGVLWLTVGYCVYVYAKVLVKMKTMGVGVASAGVPFVFPIIYLSIYLSIYCEVSRYFGLKNELVVY